MDLQRPYKAIIGLTSIASDLVQVLQIWCLVAAFSILSECIRTLNRIITTVFQCDKKGSNLTRGLEMSQIYYGKPRKNLKKESRVYQVQRIKNASEIDLPEVLFMFWTRMFTRLLTRFLAKFLTTCLTRVFGTGKHTVQLYQDEENHVKRKIIQKDNNLKQFELEIVFNLYMV